MTKPQKDRWKERVNIFINLMPTVALENIMNSIGHRVDQISAVSRVDILPTFNDNYNATKNCGKY
jgi:hypothetical protein